MIKATLPKGYKPSELEEYMNPLQLQYFKNKLLLWKEDILKESTETIRHLQQESWHDPDPTDRAYVEMNAAFELRTRDRYRKLVDKIEAAIERIENAKYGFCEETGEKIGLERLEARPIATLCIDAQESHEYYENQHSSEE